MAMAKNKRKRSAPKNLSLDNLPTRSSLRLKPAKPALENKVVKPTISSYEAYAKDFFDSTIKKVKGLVSSENKKKKTIGQTTGSFINGIWSPGEYDVHNVSQMKKLLLAGIAAKAAEKNKPGKRGGFGPKADATSMNIDALTKDLLRAQDEDLSTAKDDSSVGSQAYKLGLLGTAIGGGVWYGKKEFAKIKKANEASIKAGKVPTQDLFRSSQEAMRDAKSGKITPKTASTMMKQFANDLKKGNMSRLKAPLALPAAAVFAFEAGMARFGKPDSLSDTGKEILDNVGLGLTITAGMQLAGSMTSQASPTAHGAVSEASIIRANAKVPIEELKTMAANQPPGVTEVQEELDRSNAKLRKVRADFKARETGKMNKADRVSDLQSKGVKVPPNAKVPDLIKMQEVQKIKEAKEIVKNAKKAERIAKAAKMAGKAGSAKGMLSMLGLLAIGTLASTSGSNTASAKPVTKRRQRRKSPKAVSRAGYKRRIKKTDGTMSKMLTEKQIRRARSMER